MKLLGGHGSEVGEVLVWLFGIEPVHPVQGLDLDGIDAAPWPLPADQLSLERPDRGFGEGVVICVAD